MTGLSDAIKTFGAAADVMGEQLKYLLPNTSIHVDFYDGNPVGIELPNTVTLKVTETQPGMNLHGDRYWG